ncbi:MAG TPA: sugar ABC transporter permease [Candidatus Hydrogenedens sp.]|nr:sugar ABC transporter permease [Candidatus Hydrogenedens sp.]
MIPNRIKYKKRSDFFIAILLLFPSLLVLIPFFIFPLFYALQLSLWGGKRNTGIFVGLKNYMVAFQSPMFWQSLRVTLYYAIMTVPTTLILGFCVAYLLSKILRGRTFLRILFFVPYVTSTVAVAMVWRIFYNPQFGFFNSILDLFGFPVQRWLLEPRGVLNILSGGVISPQWGPSLALVCISLFDIWHTFGFAVVVFLTAMSTLPKEYYEAAQIDGARPLQVLFHIELPLLSPTWLFLITVQLIRSLQSFSSFYALSPSSGRTMGTTENLMLHIYSQFYEYGYWGYGSAVAILLSIFIMALTFIQWQWTRRYVFYQ